MPVRLYLDEDVRPGVARLLRERGFDALSAHELGRTGFSDPDHLDYATKEGRVLFSYNYGDYNRIAVAWGMAGREHGGILLSYRQFSREATGVLLGRLISFLASADAALMRNTVRYLEEFTSS